MSKMRVAGLVSLLLLGGLYYLESSSESYSLEKAEAEMETVVKDVESWYAATGSYIGAPKSPGVAMAAGDTMWGAARSFETADGSVCLIAGNLGKGSKVSVATEHRPCTSDGVKELQGYICTIEGKTQSCPEI